MKRVEQRKTWRLYDPRDVPELLESYGSQFETIYEQLENTNRALTIIPALTLWEQLVDAQIETGGVFVLYHDAINSAY